MITGVISPKNTRVTAPKNENFSGKVKKTKNETFQDILASKILVLSKLLFVLSNVEEWILSFFRDREIFLNFRGWGILRGIILIHLF